MDTPTGTRAPQRKRTAPCVWQCNQGREGGEDGTLGQAWGTVTLELCVLREGPGPTACNGRAQGRDEQGPQIPYCADQPTTPSGHRRQREFPRAAPRSHLSPFQAAPSLAKGKGYMHLAGQEGKGDTYQIQQPTDTFGRPRSRLSPLPSVQSLLPLPNPLFIWAKRRGTVPSGSHCISLCSLICNCGEPPD